MKRTTMKKTKSALMALASALAVAAASECTADSKKPVYPIGFAIWDTAQFPMPDEDVIGLRFCLLYGRNANVYGLDLGVFGCAVEGNTFGLELSGLVNTVGMSSGTVQLAGLMNFCDEDFSLLQFAGLASSTGQDFYGIQLSGLVNNTGGTLHGMQIGGLLNKCDDAYGMQIGLINIAQRAHGLLQIGLVNYIRANKEPFFPVINARF